jgi:hypothetical protein
VAVSTRKRPCAAPRECTKLTRDPGTERASSKDVTEGQRGPGLGPCPPSSNFEKDVTEDPLRIDRISRPKVQPHVTGLAQEIEGPWASEMPSRTKKMSQFSPLGSSKRCHKRAPGIHLSSTLSRGPEIHQRCHSGGYPAPASAVGRFGERCHDPARRRGFRFGVQTEEPQKMSRTAIDARTTKGCPRRSWRSPKVWEGR